MNVETKGLRQGGPHWLNYAGGKRFQCTKSGLWSHKIFAS